jgi:hypothetical protein
MNGKKTKWRVLIREETIRYTTKTIETGIDEHWSNAYNKAKTKFNADQGYTANKNGPITRRTILNVLNLSMIENEGGHNE